MRAALARVALSFETGSAHPARSGDLIDTAEYRREHHHF
jgi:hypothetical protein